MGILMFSTWSDVADEDIRTRSAIESLSTTALPSLSYHQIDSIVGPQTGWQGRSRTEHVAWEERVAKRAPADFALVSRSTYRSILRHLKMKRKASVLDEHTSWDSWSPLSDSSTSSCQTINEKVVGTVPWTLGSTSRSHVNDHINFRTRKRVRDNRPNLEAVHQNTLAKLFDAQRQHQAPGLNVQPGATQPVYQDNLKPALMEVDEPTQRSLHSFFNIGERQLPIKQRAIPLQQGTNIASTACEDCGNDLYQFPDQQNQSMSIIDIDQRPHALLEENYDCAVCTRSICDMCAVRGDHRLCLECAMPGSG